jgi:fatty acid desaturase
MSAAATVRPSDLLTSAETQALGRRSDWIGAAVVAHAWIVIGAVMALFALWPNPLTFLLGVMIVGTRQLGLAILMHDAAHGLLFRSRAANDAVGQWLCAWPVWTSLTLYRPYHLKHHRFTQQAEDPDLGLSAPFPITWASFRRKALRDLTGQTAYQRRKAQVLNGMGDPSAPLWTRLANLWGREKGPFAVNALLFAGCAAAGVWWVYPLMWLLPLFTWHQLVVRVRNIAEHAMVPDNDDPLRNTRTTIASWLDRAFVAPYWVNYHLEHHLLLFVPCWRLPAAHRALLAGGHGPRMEVTRGYREVLRLACSRGSESPRDGSRPRGMQHI